jgi:hypothetical protein
MTRHGGYGGDQDRLTPYHKLSAFTAAQIQAGDASRKDRSTNRCKPRRKIGDAEPNKLGDA